MLAILAFIGLLCILWLLSKGLMRLGSWLDSLSESMADRAVVNIRTEQNSDKARATVTKVRDTLNKIKGEDCSNNTYMDTVRKEINDLTEKGN